MSVALSIIIVNYNSGPLLEACVASLRRDVRLPVEIVIVDNASTDASLAFLSGGDKPDAATVLIRNVQNEGFAAANNRGAERAGGQWLHFLNPDTLGAPALDSAYRRILTEQRAVIYVTPLKQPDGTLVKSYYLLPLVSNYLKALVRSPAVRYWHLGASVIMRRDLFERLGRWATDYFMYAEDLDLFYRAALEKVPVVVLDEAPITHVSQGSTGKVWNEYNRALRVEQAYVKFSRKYGRMADYYAMTASGIVRKLLKFKPNEAWLQFRVFLRAGGVKIMSF